MFLTSFNTNSVFGNACFMCICLKTAIWLLWDKVCLFGKDRSTTLSQSLSSKTYQM